MDKPSKQQIAEHLRGFAEANMPTRYVRHGQTGNVQRIIDEGEATVEFAVSFKVDCTLTLSVTTPASVSWSGTSRSPLEALTAVALYREVAEFAAAFELLRLELSR